MRNPEIPTPNPEAAHAEIETEQSLQLCSDNPSPEVPLLTPFEPASANVQMARYRVAAVFGELRWVSRNAA